MRAVIQRVKAAEVWVAGERVSRIDHGLLTLLGIEATDTEQKLRKTIERIANLRIFGDENGKMNLSLHDIKGQHLIVSQFTLVADCSSGRRPSFTTGAPPGIAKPLYERAIEISREMGVDTRGGVFQAEMQITLTNDGPVTFVLD
ncbi:MAG: D-tyrosyl-tRNA(Tyr) deacylase [Bdellovibrionales bacterium RIFOXYC1_FULL_54_43]|nr:MAG: D-tyrosyl-tRNA(Tyr) deacylase [Bdellovibrionales bacterium RIFOXYC1_FULL_54_43]OFZ81132.1 MAG: D-tyrosyl-tRNA(Tyr) deacylase [Bdellovibrionales bacterium RIFOXYD1_FULL_55_31]